MINFSKYKHKFISRSDAAFHPITNSRAVT